MSRQIFTLDNDLGSLGEDFVDRHAEALLGDGLLVGFSDVPEQNVEGGDLAATILETETADDFLPFWLDDETIAGKEAVVIQKITHGGIEVKTVRNLLFRTNDDGCESGTLGFEIWSSDEREVEGWFLKILRPERYQNAVQPKYLVFLLLGYALPFCCISFEITALLDRVIKIGKSVDFDVMGEIPCGSEAEGWKPGRAMLIKNMWHIPFDRLRDIAVVTMIGKKPRIRPDIISQYGELRCTSELQEKRYEYLVECAGGRWIGQDEELAPQFWQYADVFSRIDYNLTLLEEGNWDAYPELSRFSRGRRKQVFEHLRAVMMNMLEHEVPEWRRNDMFLVTNDYIQQWAKSNLHVAGSRISWQSHLILLQDLGLITAFRATRANLPDKTQTINYDRSRRLGGKASTFRSVPLYTDEVLGKAEKIAAAYKEANVGHLTKESVAVLRGQEVANRLYLDSRVESSQSEWVRQTYMDAIIAAAQGKGYASVDEVYAKTMAQIRKTEPIGDIDLYSPIKAEESKRLQRRRLYEHDLKKWADKKSVVADMAGYEYRPLRNDEKAALGLPTNFRKWVFVPKR